MNLPERKSQTLIRAIMKFNENITGLQAKHKEVSNEILGLSLQLLETTQDNIELAEKLEDAKYEMDNDILLNLEINFETLGGFELDLVDIDGYLPNLKDEQELLKDLQLSVKNLIKTASVAENTLNKQEKVNLEFLYNSYTKLVAKTQTSLNDINQIMTEKLQKVKKMEII